MKDLIRVSDEVGHALAERRPVVALETTLVAHGFPRGEGYAVGASSEAAVREAGALPATVGILEGGWGSRVEVPSSVSGVGPASGRRGSEAMVAAT